MNDVTFPTPELYARGQRLRADRVTADIISAFKSDGIRSILLKGPAIAGWLYAENGTRVYCDTDLLVDPIAIPAAEQILRSAGFAFSDPPHIIGDRPRHADNWVRERDGAAIDLHRTLMGAGAESETVWEVLSGRTERLHLHEVEIEILDLPARCAHVALHAAQQGPSGPRALQDLERALDMVELVTWKEAALVAEQIDALAAFTIGLAMDSRGSQLVEKLSLPSPSSAEAILRAGGTRAALGLNWLSDIEGWMKVKFVVGKLFPPPDYIRDWNPIKIPGRLGLILGYIWRPIWLILHLRSAWRAVREARRRTDPSK